MRYTARNVAAAVIGVASVLTVVGGLTGLAGLAHADEDGFGEQACRDEVDRTEEVRYDYQYAGCDPTRYGNRGSNGNSSRTVNGHPTDEPLGQGLTRSLL